jgi:hypothetical protein
MNDRKAENVKDLFERFLSTEQADEAFKDVVQGERILSENPAPEPDKQLIADIKGQVATRLAGRRANVLTQAAWKVTAAAAVIVILAVVSVRLFEIGGDRSGAVARGAMVPKAIWESDDIAADDGDLVVLAAQVKEIEGEILTVQLGENGRNGERAVMELEIEYVELKSDFWKE